MAINDFYLRGRDAPYPLGQIQSQGRTHGVMAQTRGAVDPAVGVRRVGARGVDWLAMSEDLPTVDNRVTRRRRRPDPAASTAPTTSARTAQLVEGDGADPAAARLLDRR